MSQELEVIVTEFFSPTVSNARKREIEITLSNFRSQPEAWRQAVGFFQQTSNQYVHWYALSVIEEMILKAWSHRTPPEKAELKTFLLEILQKRSRNFQIFILNKVIKVLVDVAKQEWPREFPDLFPVIQQMTQSPELIQVGLMLLKTVCEEFVSLKDDVSAIRRKELGNLLMDQVPGILSLVKLILDTQYEKLLTPLNLRGPSQSPNYGSPLDTPFRARTSSQNRGYDSFLGLSAGNEPEKFVNTKNLDSAKKQICTLGLEILLQLFSWIQLSTHINQQLLTTLFHFAALNDDTAVGLGVLAMSCINEMLSKSCVPQEFEEYLIQIFRNIFSMLQDLTDDNPNKVGSHIEDLDENYREKFTEFINLFLTQHIHRVESAMNFPVIEFLEQLFKFTFMQPTIDSFKSCLETWSIFLEYLVGKKAEMRQPSDGADIEGYRNGMVALLRELLKKIMYRTNGQDLAEINDISEDANGATEWDSFIQECVDIIGRVAELFPEPVLESVYPLFEEDSAIFLFMHEFLVHQQTATVEDKTKMFCATMDLRTELTIFGRLSELFCSSFEGTLASTPVFLGKILSIGMYCRQYELHKQGVQIVKLMMQLLATLQAFSHWLSLFLTSCSTSPERQAGFQVLLGQIVTVLIELLEIGIPDILGLVAANFLQSLSASVRTPFLLTIPAVQSFMAVIHTLAPRIPLNVRCVCYSALSNLFILPFPNLRDTEQGWDTRGPKYVEFVGLFLGPFKALQQYPNFVESKMYQQPEVRVCVQETLKISKSLVDSVKNEGKAPKALVYDSLKDTLPAISSFFPLYLNDSGLAEVFLEFFLSLFESLRTQVGPAFIRDTITMFLSLIGGEQLAVILSRDQVSGADFAAKFISLLKIIVEEPGKSMEAFVPSVISLCLTQLYPVVRSSSTEAAAHISPAFFDLIKSILLVQWKYFFPVSAVSSQASQMSNSPSQPLQGGAGHVSEFTSLLEIIVNSFKTTDISTFKSNLETLQVLNEKKYLFTNAIFRQHMFYAFVEIFFQVLVIKSHELLKEEIVNTLYNMASVDFDSFYGQVLLTLLDRLEVTPQQRQLLQADLRFDRDLPSFSSNMTKLVADCAYFKMQNTASVIRLT